MIAEILSTGEEVLTGGIVDSNAAYISQLLDEIGVTVQRHSTVGDDLDSLVGVLKEIGGRADMAIVTGGLGPTTDDLSAAAAAAAAGVKLILDKTALANIEAFFRQRNVEMKPINKKQAYFPEGADRLDNPVGTAPGFGMTIGKCRFLFLPGVPFEMRRMMGDQVLPEINMRLGDRRVYNLTRVISTFGLSESAVGQQLGWVERRFPGVILGFQVMFPGILVKLYRRGDSEKECAESLDAAASWVCDRLGNNVVSLAGERMEIVVGQLLSRRKETVAVAESCTGGLISHWLTNVAGSSDYFLFSGVTYSNDAKVKVLGVSPDTLDAQGAVHEKTVGEMAQGARRIAGATYGIATSGIAGPGGGTPEKPVGTVCIGLASPGGTETHRFQFTYGQRRVMNKEIFAMKALDLLRRKLLND